MYPKKEPVKCLTSPLAEIKNDLGNQGFPTHIRS